MVNLGIFITQLLGYFMSYGQMWRVVLAAGGVIGLSLGFGLFTICESPKWLATHSGKAREARDILQKLRGDKFDVEEELSSWGVTSLYQGDDSECSDI
jgi:MFS family permease